MPAAASFKNWLKASTNMKLSSDNTVNRVIKEGITSFESLADFDTKSIQDLPSICIKATPEVLEDVANNITAKAPVLGANVSSISVQRLIVAVHAAKYYIAIGRDMNVNNMHFNNVLSTFKIEYDAYKALKDEDEPKVPKLNDRDSDRKVIRWAPIFSDYLSRCFGSRGPLLYVIREDSAVPTEATDPLGANSYFGASGSLQAELIARLPHTGPIYRQDNSSVYLKIEESVRGTSVESTLKSFSRTKDGRGAYLALISNHADATKYRNISKKRMNFLQNLKWNGRSYPLETHVSNHRLAYDDLRDCSTHVTVTVPNPEQRVEYLIDSITCSDNTLQAAIGLIRANTNNMRSNFEDAASSLIEVDPYRRSSRANQNSSGRNANISAIDFGAGRGESGVDLRWHPPADFKKLPDEQKDELTEWLNNTPEGKKEKADAKRKRKRNDKDNGDPKKTKNNNNAWKKKLKAKMKTDKGLATVMSILAEQEKSNVSFAAALTNAAPANQQNNSNNDGNHANISALAQVAPATVVKLNTILKNNKKTNGKGPS